MTNPARSGLPPEVHPGPAAEPLSRQACAIGAGLSLAVAVYVTLLPFTFGEGLSLGEAWTRYWQHLASGDPLGSNRTQWLANALLFAPLGLFTTAYLSWGMDSRLARSLCALVAAALGLLVTGTVEFLQQWLPYRHPALADISGNFTGGALGAAAWLAMRRPLLGWRAALESGGPRALRAGLTVYAAGYVAVGLLPFHLVLTPRGLVERLGDASVGLWRAEGACAGDAACVALLGLEVMAALPVGLLLAMVLPSLRARPLLLGALVAGLTGGLLEGVNLISAVGHVEGRSALMRALGIAAGIAGGAAWSRLGGDARAEALAVLQRSAPVAGLVALPGYVLLLMAVHHGLGPYEWDLAAARERLAGLTWAPFYYHYHVGELASLRSVLLHAALYAPVGLLVRLLGQRWSMPPARHVMMAATTAAVLGVLMEAGTVLLQQQRPDTATPLIAAAASAATAALLAWALDAARRPAAAGRPLAHAGSRPGATPPGLAARLVQVLGLLVGGVTAVLAASWPVMPGALVAGLALYALVLARYPLAWLWVLPPCVALLDGTLWTGRLYLGELELVLLTTLAVALVRWGGAPSASVCAAADAGRPRPGWIKRQGALLPRGVRWALAGLTLSTLIAWAIAWTPPPALDPGALSHYATSWNAVRAAQGLLAALALWLLVRACPRPVHEQIERGLVPGMALGGLAAVAAVVRERALYPGLLELDTPYRVTGWFTDMHVGGPSLAAFLVMTLPFLVHWGWQRRRGVLLVTAALAIPAAYAVVVTITRSAWLGAGVALLILLLLGALALARAWGVSLWSAAARAATPVVASVAVAGALAGGFAGERWSETPGATEDRLERWRAVLALPGGSGASFWLGRGLGSFPEIYREAGRHGTIPAHFAFIGADAGPPASIPVYAAPQGGLPAGLGAADLAALGSGEPRLRLGVDPSLRIQQRLAHVPGSVSLRARVRGTPGTAVTIGICEVSILYADRCRGERFELGGMPAAAASHSDGPREADGSAPWRTVTADLDLSGLGAGPVGWRRAVAATVTRPDTQAGLVEVAEVRLEGPDGASLLRNPDFRQYGRHWLPATADLDAWRVESQPLEIYFDQGLLGVAAWLALLLAVAVHVLRHALDVHAGAVAAVAIGAAVSGVLAIGLVGTFSFNPHIATLFYVLLLLGAAAAREAEGRASRRAYR